MQLFLDECLSPAIAGAINRQGQHLAKHPRDFRALVASESVHPGLIVLPCVSRRESEALLHTAIRHLSELGDPMRVMVNRVLEVSTEGEIALLPLNRETG